MSKSVAITAEQQQARLTFNQCNFNNNHRINKLVAKVLPVAVAIINTMPLAIPTFKGMN
jgi:hypothetical protein